MRLILSFATCRRSCFADRIITAVLALLLGGSALNATAISVGFLSFDVLIPGGQGVPGVNAFTIGNLTGDPGLGGFALPPDFPVLTELTYHDASLTLFTPGMLPTILLGDIGPGFSTPSSLQFPDTDQFTSALFTATLTPTTFLLDGGGSFIASPILSATLLPSSGQFLSAGDLVLIDAQEAEPSEIPEPATYGLIALGIGCLLVIHRRR